MEAMCPVDLAGEHAPLRRGWKLGAEDFADRLVDKLARAGKEGECASERREVDQILAERLIREGLRRRNWKMNDLRQRPKSDPFKVALARQLRAQTPVTRRWISERLHMGSPSYLSSLLQHDDSKL